MSCDHQCTFFLSFVSSSRTLRLNCAQLRFNRIFLHAIYSIFSFQSLMENCYIVFDSSAQFFCYAKNENFSNPGNKRREKLSIRWARFRDETVFTRSRQHAAFFLRLFGTNRNIKSGSLSLFSWLTVDWLEVGIFSICHFLYKMDGEWKREMSHQSLVWGISLLLLGILKTFFFVFNFKDRKWIFKRLNLVCQWT